MRQKYDPIVEIKDAESDFYEYKNPITNDFGSKINYTVFDVEESLKQTFDFDEEPIEDNSPVDGDGYLCVERFFDFKTGKLLTDYFKTLRTHQVGGKTYHEVYVPASESSYKYLIDFDNRKPFPALLKGTHNIIQQVDTFGGEEIVILSKGFDEVFCLTKHGKQIQPTCLNMKKITYGNIDLLEIVDWVNPDYEVNDLRTKVSYFGSDGFWYVPAGKQVKEGSLSYFKRINNQVKEKKTTILS